VENWEDKSEGGKSLCGFPQPVSRGKGMEGKGHKTWRIGNRGGEKENWKTKDGKHEVRVKMGGVKRAKKAAGRVGKEKRTPDRRKRVLMGGTGHVKE